MYEAWTKRGEIDAEDRFADCDPSYPADNSGDEGGGGGRGGRALQRGRRLLLHAQARHASL